MKEANILIFDDDADVTLSLSRALKASGVSAHLHAATQIEQAKKFFKDYSPEVVILDLCLDPRQGVESGFSVLQDFIATDPTTRIIILTGHGGIEHGIKALQLGAANFLEKPADIMHLKALIDDAITQSKLKRIYQNSQKQQLDKDAHRLIAGKSPAMLEVIEAVKYASQTMQPVLICGETGTGKGVCATAIHELSSRSNNNFVRFQPHFGTPDMVHSDLFGHLAGSFTGASEKRSGLLAEADGGTFFLDEVDEVPLETQIALLGVIQEKRFRPVGSDKTRNIDIRLITATNQNIQHSLADGKIRPDFYHRIAHFTLEIPPLRQHKEDIPILVETFLRKYRTQYKLNVFDIEGKALKYLIDYDWPGNVRELEAVIENGAYHANYSKRTVITLDDVAKKKSISESFNGLTLQERVKQFKYQLVKDALAHNEGNQVKAAKTLGIDRTTLRRILGEK